MAKTRLLLPLFVIVAITLTGCVSIPSNDPPPLQEDPFVTACDLVREMGDAYIDMQFALTASKASEAATAFDSLAGEDAAQVVGFAEVLRNFASNEGKYSDDAATYSELLTFCKSH